MQKGNILRIISCEYSIYNHSLVMQVESLNTQDKNGDHVYLIIAPMDRVRTEEDVKYFIEKEIAYQDKVGIPNYHGLEWKSS